MKLTKRQKRIYRHKRLKAKISGTAEVPRVSVFRSNKHIFVQLVDDTIGKTLVSSTIKSVKNTIKGTKTELAEKIGEMVAQKAKEAGISRVVFDRGGYKYHGRIRAVAEGLRRSGLIF